jgi:hypothetical protein
MTFILYMLLAYSAGALGMFWFSRLKPAQIPVNEALTIAGLWPFFVIAMLLLELWDRMFPIKSNRPG